jgi:hypothetical protein
MIMRMLIERGVATRLNSKVAQVKMRSLLLRTYQNLARGAVSPTVVRSISTQWHILPAELAVIRGMKAVYNAHQLSPVIFFFVETSPSSYYTLQ